MVAQGNTVGVLHLEFESAAELQRDSGRESFRESRQQLAVSAASQIALSLASLQLRETLREQAVRDPLTLLFNRRFLEESLEREIQLAARKKQSIAVLFLDLDHFKRFNDTFGHDAGDMVLQLVPDDAPIEGRIIDAQGKPAAGAQVSLYQVCSWIRGEGGPPPGAEQVDWYRDRYVSPAAAMA